MKLNKNILKGPTIQYDNYFEKYIIEFDDGNFKNSINTFLSSNIRILNIVSEYITISSIKLYKELITTDGLKELIYVGLSSLNDSVVESFKSKSIDHLLVIELDLNKTKCDDWVEKIRDIIDTIQNSIEKKLIIISNQKDVLENILSVDMKIDKINDNSNTLKNLTKDSQMCFLNREIKFQKFNVKLGDVILNDELKETINGEILMRILEEEALDIGKEIEGLKDVENYYIDRKLIHRMKSEKNIYLLIDINEEDLCFENQNFTVIERQERSTDNQSDMFYREIKKNPSKNIYMLRRRGNEFILIEKLKNSFDKSDFENSIKSVHDCKVSLISAVPRMGKSTFFTSLSRKMKNHNPELWIIKIDLNSVSSILKKMSHQEIQFVNVVNFLHCSANHQSNLEKTIFEHCLQIGNVVLFLDAFDEICPNYKPVMIKIIEELKEKAKIKKIWISTRPYDTILDDLKNTFNDFSLDFYNIEPFTEDDRIEYLKNSWKRSIKINEESFTTFVNLLFESLSKSIDDRTREFLGIALHTMIIGVTFKDPFEDFQKSDSSKINDLQEKLMKMVGLLKMYEKFVQIKFEIWWVEKNKENLDIVTSEILAKSTLDKCVEEWKILALGSLFEENALTIFLTKEDTGNLEKFKKDKFKEKGDDIGIMNRIVDNKPFFIHRTFAEYFTAVFLFDSLMKEDEKSLKITEYFLENMINQEHFMICQFVNCMFNDENSKKKENHANLIGKLNGEKLYIALKNKWQWIAIWLIENEVNLEYTSDEENEKNLLHFLYSQQENMEMADHLIKIMFIKLKVDNKLMNFLQETDNYGNTALNIAALYGKFTHLKHLLNEYVKLEILDSFIMNENEHGQNVLHHAAYYNCNEEVLTYLMEFIKSDVVKMERMLLKRDNSDYTPLDLTVIYNQINKMKTILEESAKLGIQNRILMNETKCGRNVLHRAADYNCNDETFTCLLDFIKNDAVTLEKMILQRDDWGETPFDWTIVNGYVNRMKSILEESSKIGIQDRVVMNENTSGRNVLHQAAIITCCDETFTFLLDFIKSDEAKMKKMLSKRDNNDHTPLDLAKMYNRQLRKVQTLLNANSNPRSFCQLI